MKEIEFIINLKDGSRVYREISSGTEYDEKSVYDLVGEKNWENLDHAIRFINEERMERLESGQAIYMRIECKD